MEGDGGKLVDSITLEYEGLCRRQIQHTIQVS